MTVVVCTYNRAELLRRALDSLCRQDLSRDLFEILVVDNASTDRTRDVVQEYMRQRPNVRYCYEPKQGLSHARNCGWRAAAGTYVAFTDDDCEPPRGWLAHALTIIKDRAPAILGGPFLPSYSDPKPRWFKDAYGSDVKADNTARPLGPHEYISGNNIFFRRSLLETFGGFDPELGMKGNAIGYGEETALQLAVRERFPTETIFYDPALHVLQLVRPEKMTWSWNIRQQFISGRYAVRVFQATLRDMNPEERRQARRSTAMSISHRLVRIASGATLGAWKRDRAIYPLYGHYVFERILPQIGELGAEWERLRVLGSR